MTADTDRAAEANAVLHSSAKNKKRRKSKKVRVDIDDLNVNPVDVETRHGVLAPWGGATGGGASTPIQHEPQKVGDD
jgi:hypothetical protein